MSLGTIAATVVGSVVTGALAGDGGGGGGGGGEETIGRDQLLAAINQYSNVNLAQSNSLYGKEAAINDSMGLINSIFKEYQNVALPNIHQAGINSGGYNSTTGQLLANDAYAATTNKAAATVLQAIKEYRGIEQQDYNVLAGLVKQERQPMEGTKGPNPWAPIAGDAAGAFTRWMFDEKPASGGGYYSGMSNADIVAGFAGS